jgi:hypothetical protein
MTIETLHNMLQWSTLISIIIMVIWFLMITFARGFLFRLYGSKLKISMEQFDVIHYTAVTFFKILIVVFQIAPLLALYIIR